MIINIYEEDTKALGYKSSVKSMVINR